MDKSCDFISFEQIKSLEQFADRLLNKVGIDIEFTRHFGERMSDSRNKPCIKIAELKDLFERIYEKNKKVKKDVKRVVKHGDDQAVLVDIQKDLNLPVVFDFDRSGKLIVTTKTIMRKKNFKTPNDKIRVESTTSGGANRTKVKVGKKTYWVIHDDEGIIRIEYNSGVRGIQNLYNTSPIWKKVEKKINTTENRKLETFKDYIAEGRKGSIDTDEGSNHVVMQLRKSITMNGQKDVKFGDGKSVKVSQDDARKFLQKYSAAKPNEKMAMQKKATDSYEGFKEVISEGIVDKVKKVKKGIDKKLKDIDKFLAAFGRELEKGHAKNMREEKLDKVEFTKWKKYYKKKLNRNEFSQERYERAIKDLEKRYGLKEAESSQLKMYVKQLRSIMNEIDKIDPANPAYKKLIKFLNGRSQEELKYVADADIKFLSMLARNRLKNVKEEIVENFRNEKLNLVCPFCGRKKVYNSTNMTPVQKHDCKCGAVAEIRLLKTDKTKTFRSVEWDRDVKSLKKLYGESYYDRDTGKDKAKKLKEAMDVGKESFRGYKVGQKVKFKAPTTGITIKGTIEKIIAGQSKDGDGVLKPDEKGGARVFIKGNKSGKTYNVSFDKLIEEVNETKKLSPLQRLKKEVVGEETVNEEKKIDWKKVSKFDNWVTHTEKHLKDAAISVPGLSPKELVKLIDQSPVVTVPNSYFKKDSYFEPYTKDDIENPRDMMPNARKIMRGFLSNKPMVYVLAFKGRGGKMEVDDGFTRSAVAMPLGIKIKAKLVDISASNLKRFKKSLNEETMNEEQRSYYALVNWNQGYILYGPYTTREKVHKAHGNDDIESILSTGQLPNRILRKASLSGYKMTKGNYDRSRDRISEIGRKEDERNRARYEEFEIVEQYLNEKELTSGETKKKEEIVKSMKDKEAEFKRRYGDKWKSVMYATATKSAKRVAEAKMSPLQRLKKFDKSRVAVGKKAIFKDNERKNPEEKKEVKEEKTIKATAKMEKGTFGNMQKKEVSFNINAPDGAKLYPEFVSRQADQAEEVKKLKKQGWRVVSASAPLK